MATDASTPEIITRKEAKAKGLTHFFSGKLCRNGHIAERYVSNGGCVSCIKDNHRIWRQNNRSLINTYNLNYRQSDKGRQTINNWRDNHPRDKELEAEYHRRPDVLKRVRDRCRDRYQNDPIYKDNLQRSQLKYRATEKGIETIRTYQARPEVKIRDKVCKDAYRKSEIGKEKNRMNMHRRRARQFENGGSFSDDDLAFLKKTQKKCYLCGTRFTKNNPGTIEHIIPLSKGGPHDITNIMLACLPCNLEKNEKILQLL